MDKGVRQILQRSQELLPVFSQPSEAGDYLVFIARIHSKTPQSSGYCGAGYEDHLFLLEYSQKHIALRDDFLLQSCLKSIALDTDSGDDILRAFLFDRSQHSIKFRWLTNPDDRNNPDDKYCYILKKAKWGKKESYFYLNGPQTYIYYTGGRAFGPIE